MRPTLYLFRIIVAGESSCGAMLLPCLLWLLASALTSVAGQTLTSPDGACRRGWECKKERHCTPFLDQKDRLERLDYSYQQGGDEHTGRARQMLASKLRELVCNKAEEGVCCKEQLEIVNGVVVERAEDMPYIARLYLKTGYAEYSICGATLIAPKFLLSAKHCFTDFWDECIEPEDCYASFRNLRPDRNDHDPGEFRIPITEVYEKEGTSDLAVVELKIKVEEHEDYQRRPYHADQAGHKKSQNGG